MKTNFFSNKLGLTLVVFFLSLITFQVLSAQDLAQDIKKSLRLVDIEQSTKSIESLNTLIKANPTNASLWYYLGYAQIKRGELDKALASFEKGTQIDPKEQLNYAGKGYVRVLQNNLTEAKSIFDKVLADTKSKNAAVLNSIAEAYLTTRKNVEAAMPLLVKSKSINSKDPETLILLGDAFLQQGNGSQGGLAVSSYENAASLDPKNAKPHYKIGIVYSRSKNVQAAVESYNKAISADPNFAPAYKELGEIYYVAKDGAKAVEAQEKYLSLTENPNPGKTQLAFYYFMKRDYDKAIELFDVVLKYPDVLPIAWRFYAVALFEKIQYEKSAAAFDQYFKVVKKEEIQPSDYASQAQSLVKLKKDSLANISLDNSLALDSTQQEILQMKAEGLVRMKRYPEVISTYKRLMAKRIQPMSMDNYSIGKAYVATNQLVEADSAFSRLIRLQPTLPIGYANKAKVKAMQDPDQKLGLAKPYFEKVIELGESKPDKNKPDLLQAYSYLASYSYNIEHSIAKTKTYYQKVLVLNPSDKDAATNLEILKKMEQKKASEKKP